MQYRERRRATKFDVILEDEQGQHRATIVDVSHIGARLRLDEPVLATQNEVALGVRGKTYPARIIWSRNNHAGVAFKDMLPLDALSTISRSLRKAPTAKKKRFLGP
ncbi:MAG: PilZ domain-containing protein [Pseudomonadota bacterium]